MGNFESSNSVCHFHDDKNNLTPQMIAHIQKYICNLTKLNITLKSVENENQTDFIIRRIPYTSRNQDSVLSAIGQVRNDKTYLIVYSKGSDMGFINANLPQKVCSLDINEDGVGECTNPKVISNMFVEHHENKPKKGNEHYGECVQKAIFALLGNDHVQAIESLLEAVYNKIDGGNGGGIAEYYLGLLYKYSDVFKIDQSEKARKWFSQSYSKGFSFSYLELIRHNDDIEKLVPQMDSVLNWKTTQTQILFAKKGSLEWVNVDQLPNLVNYYFARKYEKIDPVKSWFFYLKANHPKSSYRRALLLQQNEPLFETLRQQSKCKEITIEILIFNEYLKSELKLPDIYHRLGCLVKEGKVPMDHVRLLIGPHIQNWILDMFYRAASNSENPIYSLDLAECLMEQNMEHEEWLKKAEQFSSSCNDESVKQRLKQMRNGKCTHGAIQEKNLLMGHSLSVCEEQRLKCKTHEK